MTRRLYGSPKVYKEGTPVWPIVDYTGSIAYNLSRSLADLLKPIVGTTEYFVKNTASFSKDIKEVNMEQDKIMISHNVVSLFINVPIKETLIIIRKRLRADKSLHESHHRWYHGTTGMYTVYHIFLLQWRNIKTDPGSSNGESGVGGFVKFVHRGPWGDVHSHSPT